MSQYREHESLGTQIWDSGMGEYRSLSSAEKEKYRIHRLAEPKQQPPSAPQQRIVTIGILELQELMDKAAKYDALMSKP